MADDLTFRDMKLVDNFISKNLETNVDLIKTISEHLILSGGKRLRPKLLLLVAGCCGYKGTNHHKLAVIIEFIHTATLLHDDVVDNSKLRRGKSTANDLFGNSASILVGDFLYSRAFQLINQINNDEILNEIANATNQIAEGEVLQLVNLENVNVSEIEYLKIVKSKTAKLFELSCLLGAIISDCDNLTKKNFSIFGTHIGIAFQLIDDILDYFGDANKLGKNIGDDLCQGKITFPIIHALRHGSKNKISQIKNLIAKPDEKNIKLICDIIEDIGSIEYTLDLAKSEIIKAKSIIKDLAPSVYKKTLLEFASMIVKKEF